MRRTLSLYAVVAVFGLSGIDVACGSSNASRPGGMATGSSDGGGDGGTDGGTSTACLPGGGECASSTSCCSGVCAAGKCLSSAFCGAMNATCMDAADCCSLACSGGRCVAQLCRSEGDSCASNAQCCSTICSIPSGAASGTCHPVPAVGSRCTTLGEACSIGADCCSTNCQGGICVRAYSCQASGDICFSNSDCCGGCCGSSSRSCTGTTEDTPLRCQVVTGGGAGGCNQDGNPCSGGSRCCSRLCVDPGSGVTVCQPATGCRLTGDSCSSTAVCCNINSEIAQTSQWVTCTDGRCDNGGSCNPPGNICNPTGPEGPNAPTDCCDGKSDVCKQDSLGLFRCFGGCLANRCNEPCTTGYTGMRPCCIELGSTCQFEDQCCHTDTSGNPVSPKCLPNENGILTCTVTPSCQAQGATCTANGDCCTGLVCSGTTCLPGVAACVKIGELCTPSDTCCMGSCKDENLNNCTGATSCMCVLPG